MAEYLYLVPMGRRIGRYLILASGCPPNLTPTCSGSQFPLESHMVTLHQLGYVMHQNMVVLCDHTPPQKHRLDSVGWKTFEDGLGLWSRAPSQGRNPRSPDILESAEGSIITRRSPLPSRSFRLPPFSLKITLPPLPYEKVKVEATT